MTVHVALYCEGGREGVITLGWSPAPGELLLEDHLGAAHVLTRRCIHEASQAPEAAVQFMAPLLAGGRLPKGSDLLRCKTLRQLTRGPWPEPRPDVVVILVDADGSARRAIDLRECLDREPASAQPVAVGVAIQEFEAWLLADTRAAGDALREEIPTNDLEHLAPRVAKDSWSSLVVRRFPAIAERRAAAGTVARTCDLRVVAARCPAFGVFRAQVAAAIGAR